MRKCLGTLVVLSLASVPIATSGQSRADARATLETLLLRAAYYLDYFVDQFENVVAEEQYIQDSSQLLPSFSPVGRGGFNVGPSASDITRARHRDLRSDYLLVKSPDSEQLLPFRDVLAVDGVPVRDHAQRIAQLFVKPSGDAITQAERIQLEGARYNLGNMRSTLGNPMLALGVVQIAYQGRFQFSLGKEDRSVGAGVWIVEYKEDAPPAMIHGEAGRDLFSHGRVWVDFASGRVMKTELQVEQPTVRATVTTTFRYDEKFGIAVPAEMREQYALGTGNRVNTVATYGHFRRFDVTAEEDFRGPLRTVADPASGFTFVEVPGGRFTMGSASSEVGRNEDETLHDVEMTEPFLLGRFEVTQQEWRTVMGTSPSHFSDCGPRCPVENVTFAEVQRFLAALNERSTAGRSKTPASADGPRLRYRLPTEAEWEYACRAGTTGPFGTGENLTTAQANYNGKFPYSTFPAGEFRRGPTPIGTFESNRWGFADMHGNVWEWTADWYGPYADHGAANIDPHGPATGEKRVIRGGSWYFDANSARCGLRYTHAPQDRGFSLGFRVAADRLRN
jgi:formylglycine-generating enzyme required for sulfatase activity